MNTYKESVHSPVMPPPASDEPRARAGIAPAPPRRATRAVERMAVERMAPGYHDATHHARTRAWRDTIQAFTHDAAELPVIARLLAGQGVLLLGYASVYGALALRRRLRGVPAPRPAEGTRSLAMPSSAMPSSAMPTPARAPRRSRPLLVGATAATGLAFAWAALVLIARTRAIPVVTALFTYGAALRQYVRPWRPPTRAA